MKISDRYRHETPVAAAVAAILCVSQATPAGAAETGSADGGLAQVVVTATRRLESIQDAPLNIAAITSSTIEDLRLDKIDDLTHWVPGVSIKDQGAWGASSVVIRGLNTNTLGEAGGGPDGRGGAVASYLGEVPLFFDFKLLDMDRVEILLGPQGTLYGAGTLAGAIRYIPKKPDLNTFQGQARGRTYGLDTASNEGYQGDAAVNVPLVDGKLAFRGVVGYYDDPGFIDYPYVIRDPGVSDPQPDLSDPKAVAANLRRVHNANFEHTLSARGSLLYQPTDNLQALLSYAYQRTRTDGRQSTFSPHMGTGQFESARRFLEPAERTAELSSLELTAHFKFADLVSASSYGDRKIDSTWDQTDLLLELVTGYEDFPKFAGFNLENRETKQFVQELRLVSNDTSRLKWIIGAFYNHFTDRQVDREYVPHFPEFIGVDSADAMEYFLDIRQKRTEEAGFGEIGYRFTDAWQVTVGAREFKYTTDQSNLVALPLVDEDVPLPLAVSDSQSGSIFKLNTSYRFTPDLMMYATVSDGYRNGGINSVPPCVLPVNSAVQHVCALPNEQSFKPDRTRNHELGLRSTWLDQRLTVNGALYYINWKDVRVSAVTQYGGENITSNGSRAVSKGVELQFQGRLSRHFSVMGSYTFDDAKLTARAPGVIGDFNGKYDGQAGDRLPGSPRHMGSLLLQYTRSLAGGYALDADYGISAISNSFSTIGLRGGGEKLPGYAVHDASVGFEKDSWHASLYAKNLFNKYVFTGVGRDTSYLTEINGFTLRDYVHSVLRPREIGIEVRKTF
jgi:outer membrane receptor protein involved in Fe transport